MPQLHSSTATDPWYVIRTHARQEFRAAHNLESGGIDVFLPRVRARRAWKGLRRDEIAPLFPQYLFARFDANARLHDVAFTRGVQIPVRVGSELAVVGDEAIRFLRSRMCSDGLISLGEPLQPGEKVIIGNGPFEALIGVVERCSSARDRVTVLLTTVQARFQVDLGLDSVRRLPRPRPIPGDSNISL
jgi:transcriptional antiterminator RfaH